MGNIFNSPLAAGDGGVRTARGIRGQDSALRSTRFRPEFIIVSAGFDAHERDPLGSLRMTADDFAWVTRKLMESAEKNCERSARGGVWRAVPTFRVLRIRSAPMSAN